MLLLTCWNWSRPKAQCFHLNDSSASFSPHSLYGDGSNIQQRQSTFVFVCNRISLEPHGPERPINTPLLSPRQQLLSFFLHPSTFYYQAPSSHQSIYSPFHQQTNNPSKEQTNATDIHHVFQHDQVRQRSHPVLSGKCTVILALVLVLEEKQSILRGLFITGAGRQGYELWWLSF